jgi:hypothetical protein
MLSFLPCGRRGSTPDASPRPATLVTPPVSPGALPPGSPVALTGLNAAEFNGLTGTVVGTDAATGRVVIRPSNERKTVKVKLENLMPLAPACTSVPEAAGEAACAARSAAGAAATPDDAPGV